MGSTPHSSSAVRADLEVIYRQYFSYVWRCLHHFGVRRPWVDDATQDVFMVVHRRLTEFDGRTSVRSWLHGIARRVASDYRRGRRRGGPRLRVVADANAGQGVDPSQGLEHRAEAADQVETFLATLDQGKRDVFVLAEVEGMSGPEIADVLGINVNTVYARLRAARGRFERAIAQQRAREARAWTA